MEKTAEFTAGGAAEYHIWFDSLEEMHAELPAMIRRHNLEASHQLTTWGMSNDAWFGFGINSYTEMTTKIRDGWPEYAELLGKRAAELDAALDLETVRAMTIDVRKRKRHRMDQGDTLDLPRVWNGDLDHAWERPVRVPRRSASQRYVTIYLDVSAAAMRNARDAVWRAIAAKKITDLFTSAGFSTEIWVGDSTSGAYVWNQNAPAKTWTGVRVKEFSQPINEDRLAAMSSVGMLRTHGFEMICGSPWKVQSSLGMPLNRGLVLPLRERQEAGERVIRIGECWSREEAIREVTAVAQSLLPQKLEEAS